MLLELDNVAYPDCEEATHFALLAPADPRLYELCLLAKAASGTLRRMKGAQG